MARTRLAPSPVPYFSLAETGVFHRVEGPRGFATWGEADEASRFLLVPE